MDFSFYNLSSIVYEWTLSVTVNFITNKKALRVFSILCVSGSENLTFQATYAIFYFSLHGDRVDLPFLLDCASILFSI